MQLKDIMTTQVEIITPDATVEAAAKKMDDTDVGALPVCDNDRLVGIITDRDIVVRSISVGQDPKQTFVRDVMTTSSIIYAFEDDQVEGAAELMEKKQVRRLPIMNRKKRMVGMVSLGDLAVHVKDQKLAGEVIEKVSEPSHKQAA
ncbi:MAG: hypothetical protein A2X94_07530 [Bdellovibrionales bacterium GWB1_55_8]|nr:MAG: hypothetical protein A2X94_07530 [Bdellovibrionales bacterium GWB1_55_8]